MLIPPCPTSRYIDIVQDRMVGTALYYVMYCRTTLFHDLVGALQRYFANCKVFGFLSVLPFQPIHLRPLRTICLTWHS